MKKIMFNDKFGLTQAVIHFQKRQTRRIAYTGIITNPNTGFGLEQNENYMFLMDKYMVIAKSKYYVGEEIAIAQSYAEIGKETGLTFAFKDSYKQSAGWNNKMYVEADKMIHRIRITNIRCERLKSISEEDCISEGIIACKILDRKIYYIHGIDRPFGTPKDAFAILINKICGKNTWNINPWVFIYEFELI